MLGNGELLLLLKNNVPVPGVWHGQTHQERTLNTNWDLVRVERPPALWITLEDSTWDAMISALAGLDNLVRNQQDDKPLSEEDQEIVDSTIDEYLVAAGLSPRPRGYVWFLRPPRGMPTLRSLHERLNTDISEKSPEASLPGELRELVQASLRHLYS